MEVPLVQGKHRFLPRVDSRGNSHDCMATFRSRALLYSPDADTARCRQVGRIAFIRQNDGACVIGLKIFSTIPMLTVDAMVNLFLTASFVIPM